MQQNIIDQLNKEFLTCWYLRNTDTNNRFNSIYFRGKQDAIIETLKLLIQGR